MNLGRRPSNSTIQRMLTLEKKAFKQYYGKNAEAKKQHQKYSTIRLQKMVASKKRYSRKREEINMYRRARYSFAEPKITLKQKYITELQKKLIVSTEHRKKLREAFDKLSRPVLTKSACRIAAKRY